MKLSKKKATNQLLDKPSQCWPESNRESFFAAPSPSRTHCCGGVAVLFLLVAFAVAVSSCEGSFPCAPRTPCTISRRIGTTPANIVSILFNKHSHVCMRNISVCPFFRPGDPGIPHGRQQPSHRQSHQWRPQPHRPRGSRGKSGHRGIPSASTHDVHCALLFRFGLLCTCPCLSV